VLPTPTTIFLLENEIGAEIARKNSSQTFCTVSPGIETEVKLAAILLYTLLVHINKYTYSM
jgi:hypothetical protein